MIKAKKSLGQNFLIDENVINTITDVLDIKDKSILEVGPGTGNLTSSLLKKKPKKYGFSKECQGITMNCMVFCVLKFSSPGGLKPKNDRGSAFSEFRSAIENHGLQTKGCCFKNKTFSI